MVMTPRASSAERHDARYVYGVSRKLFSGWPPETSSKPFRRRHDIAHVRRLWNRRTVTPARVQSAATTSPRPAARSSLRRSWWGRARRVFRRPIRAIAAPGTITCRANWRAR